MSADNPTPDDAADPGRRMADDAVEQALRWRLVLGEMAEDELGFDTLEKLSQEPQGSDSGRSQTAPRAGDGSGEASGDFASRLREAERADQALSYIYDREMARRAHRVSGTANEGLSVPAWVSGVRELFPREAVQVIERDALTRYGMTELVTDPELLRKAEPSEALMRAILQFKHMMDSEVLEVARELVKTVVEDMSGRIMQACTPALFGPRATRGRPPMRTFRNIDWQRTIRRNLRNWDAEREALVADRFSFEHRQRQRAAWRIIIAVDQSGSMMDSLIHSSIMAAIFCAVPSLDVRLVLWDTRVVDATPMASDPLEVLMNVQLGGGTDLLPALNYCESLVSEPRRTLLVVVSDWYLWSHRDTALARAASLHESGVHCIGLCALDADSRAVYDAEVAGELADCGWFVAALTPKKLAEHVGEIVG